jgi:hypothetical protein
MALKDYRWTIEGESTFADLTLNNIVMRVRSVNYNAETRVAQVEVLAREGDGKFEHSRNFSYELQGDDESLSSANVQAFIDAVFDNANRVGKS